NTEGQGGGVRSGRRDEDLPASLPALVGGLSSPGSRPEGAAKVLWASACRPAFGSAAVGVTRGKAWDRQATRGVYDGIISEPATRRPSRLFHSSVSAGGGRTHAAFLGRRGGRAVGRAPGGEGGGVRVLCVCATA
ncbi:unnamed protein product, partial [Hapterophycus canaliculatus]